MREAEGTSEGGDDSQCMGYKCSCQLGYMEKQHVLLKPRR